MAYYIRHLVFIWNSNMAVQNSPFEIRLGNNNEFKLGRKIGSGAFGDTYIGTNIHTGKEGRVYYVFNLILNPQN